jgi:hypothetical protein
MAPAVQQGTSETGIVLIYPSNPGEAVFTLAVVLSITTFLVLLLRFWSRALLPATESRYRCDDWMAAAAWVSLRSTFRNETPLSLCRNQPFVVAISIQTCLLLRHGFGRHIDEVLEIAPTHVSFSLQFLYVGYLTHTVAMAFIRISVGLFYGRLFCIAVPSFQWQVHANTALNFIWLLGLNLAAAFECTPVSGFWDKSINGAKCMPTLNIQLGSVMPSVALDLVALIMPLPIIWKLHLSPNRKALLLATFILGYSVIFLSVGRLVAITIVKTGLDNDSTCEYCVVHSAVSDYLWLIETG